jgi:hypothetical protein
VVVQRSVSAQAPLFEIVKIEQHTRADRRQKTTFRMTSIVADARAVRDLLERAVQLKNRRDDEVLALKAQVSVRCWSRS